MKFNGLKNKIVILLGFLFVAFMQAPSVFGASEYFIFNVEKSFDAAARNQVTATLVKTSPHIYFYVEKPWWDSQLQAKKNEILAYLNVLSNEFDGNIYPTLTSVFGNESKPGVDGDERITVLFHAMNSAEGGYFREADEYIKLQSPDSNEKEMVYLSLDRIDDLRLKVLLAHEFMHLITFNQKNKIFNAEESTWLNEARADYSSTILGYDNSYDGSNLQQRSKDFAEDPSNSLTEWTGNRYDYSSVSMFNHYLMDHYGVGILIDSLKSKYVGIESINYALQKNGVEERFSDIFTDWTIASLVNDCSMGQKYCYLNKNLKNFRIVPALNFLPVTGNVSLSVTNVTKGWTGNWLKFIGGNGNLALDFSSLKGLSFSIPYIKQNSAGAYSIGDLVLDSEVKGKLSIANFGTDYKSLVIIPSLQPNIYRSDDLEPTYPFSYTVAISSPSSADNQDLISQLLEKIESLKRQIAEILALNGGSNQNNQCVFDSNISFGSSGEQVSCLQDFLKNQGQDIYPEGLVTGYFGSLTRQAVIRFQEKYASEILVPVDLANGTGYVGQMTRNKINSLLGR